MIRLREGNTEKQDIKRIKMSTMGNHPNESPDLGPVDVNDNTAHPDKTYDSVREHRILHLSDYLITRPEPDHTAADSKDGNTCVEGISGPAVADTPGLDCQTEISDDARRRREDWPALKARAKRRREEDEKRFGPYVPIGREFKFDPEETRPTPERMAILHEKRRKRLAALAAE